MIVSIQFTFVHSELDRQLYRLQAGEEIIRKNALLFFLFDHFLTISSSNTMKMNTISCQYLWVIFLVHTNQVIGNVTDRSYSNNRIEFCFISYQTKILTDFLNIQWTFTDIISFDTVERCRAILSYHFLIIQINKKYIYIYHTVLSFERF